MNFGLTHLLFSKSSLTQTIQKQKKSLISKNKETERFLSSGRKDVFKKQTLSKLLSTRKDQLTLA
jgi:hypothetical protein